MNRKSILPIILLLLLASICPAQQQTDAPEIYVESWSVGNKIREQVLNFNLNSSKREYTAIIPDVGAGYYKLIMRHFPAGKENYRLEYWAVQLKPILPGRKGKEKLGDNLLTFEGTGPGGDNFPKEDWVGVLYPLEAPKSDVEKLLNRQFYPIRAKRVIKVENFYLIIKVDSFKMNEADPKKLDSMNVTIEFKNTYKECNSDTQSNNSFNRTRNEAVFHSQVNSSPVNSGVRRLA